MPTFPSQHPITPAAPPALLAPAPPQPLSLLPFPSTSLSSSTSSTKTHTNGNGDEDEEDRHHDRLDKRRRKGDLSPAALDIL